MDRKCPSSSTPHHAAKSAETDWAQFKLELRASSRQYYNPRIFNCGINYIPRIISATRAHHSLIWAHHYYI
jgi:hypothetical protein